MPDYHQAHDEILVLSAKDQAARTNAFIAYILMGIGLFTGIFWLIGAIWAMVKKGDANGTLFEDHYSNIIKVFWLGLLFYIIGGILAVVLVGYLIIFLVWIWSVYKIVKGFLRITSNRPYRG